MVNYLITPEKARWVIAQADSVGELIEKDPTVNYCMKHNKGFLIVNLSTDEVEVFMSEDLREEQK